MIKVNVEEIVERKKTLERAKAELKQHFIGIDKIIDDLLDYIQIWYLMPEILKRPVIVNLWGMTGVGKTDLIRKLVKALNYQDRFAEIELSNIDATNWKSSVASVLEDNELHDGKPGIVLFDEIQRFNTLNERGEPLPQTKFMDFWELLSDGKLSKKTRDDLDQYLNSYMYRKKENKRKKERGEEVTEDNPMLGIWDAQQMKRLLGLEQPVYELADLPEEEMIELILNAKVKKVIYEPVDHAQTLIIISGNLDEAFQMAGHTSEADIDADIFHAFTTKITVVDVKDALTRKFRPEQVARFGNIHLIYTSLRRIDFEQLIAREIERIAEDTRARFGIRVQVDENIQHLIYRNGVFPVQGVRPVFSSIIDILETNLTSFIYTCLVEGYKSIAITYDEKAQAIVAKLGKKTLTIPYVGRIDRIRQSNQADAVANISVHEAGHAVVYMALLGMAPLQLKCKVASSYAGGFTFPHEIHQTKRSLLNTIKIYLAGGLAEELIFGSLEASVGRENDRQRATMYALDYLRKYGFDENYQAHYALDSDVYRIDNTQNDHHVEKMVTRLVAETKALLHEQKELLRGLAIELSLKGSLEANEMVDIAKRYGLNILQRPEGYLYIAEYDQQLKAEF